MNARDPDEVRTAAQGRRSSTRLPALLACVCSAPAFLAGCGEPAEAPLARTQPSTQGVRVWGSAGPDLMVRVFTRWLSTSAECRASGNMFRRLDGRTTPGSAWVEAQVERAGEAYEARIALDHFEAGECGWHPFVIAFHVTNADGTSTGHFEATAGGGRRLVPGPQELVWIDSPPVRAAQQAAGSQRGAPPQRGSRFVRPLELVCAENRIRDARGLSCVPESPRELALISQEAEAVRVDFRTGRPAGF